MPRREGQVSPAFPKECSQRGQPHAVGGVEYFRLICLWRGNLSERHQQGKSLRMGQSEMSAQRWPSARGRISGDIIRSCALELISPYLGKKIFHRYALIGRERPQRRPPGLAVPDFALAPSALRC